MHASTHTHTHTHTHIHTYTLPTQVLEAREQVEETDDATQLKQLLDDNRRRQAKQVATISAAFKSESLPEAIQNTMKLTYLVRLEQEIVKKMPFT